MGMIQDGVGFHLSVSGGRFTFHYGKDLLADNVAVIGSMEPEEDHGYRTGDTSGDEGADTAS
tara:strand:+ start:4397 stop:4582 length:186 start_codon:yes stop_codon:yes gene_type:complete